jgi:hypothetical protein
MMMRSSARAVTEAASDGWRRRRPCATITSVSPAALTTTSAHRTGWRSSARCHSSLSAGCRRPDLPATGRARRPILTPVCRPVRKIVLIDGWRRIGVVAHSRDNLHPLVSLSQAVGLYLPSLSMV